MTVVRYITQHDLDAYRHWRVTYYGERGDGLTCFVASWKCCESYPNTVETGAPAARPQGAGTSV